MLGYKTTAPTATASTVKVKNDLHPWPCATLPEIILQYLSASLMSA